MAASKQNILILGATGATGLVFIKAALKDPSKPHLTLFVRTPSKLPAEFRSSPQITIVKGDLDDTDAISQAMKGATTVISFLGAYITLSNFLNRSTATPIADCFPLIFEAMRKEGVKRIIALSSIGGFKHPQDEVGWTRYWLQTHIAPKAVVPAGAAEMKAIGELVSQQSDLEWTVFRVPIMHDGDPEGEAVVETAEHLGPEFKGTINLSRTSLVKWILGELDERRWVGKGVALGNP